MMKSPRGFNNTLLPEQNGPHFADFQVIVLIENVCIFNKIS